MTDLAFYCVVNSRYFLGAAGTINSLRRAGHAEPIFILDCGLTAAQRALLGAEATLVENPRPERLPFLLKTFAPLAHPAEVMVLIDVDMVVTRNLAPLIEAAGAGRVAAIEDWQSRRFCPEWRTLPGLEAAAPGPYVSSGLVALPHEPGLGILARMQELEDHVDFDSTFWRANDRDYPFLYADQDVLNAVLRAQPAEVVEALLLRLAATPPYHGLRLLERHGLRCAFRDGFEPLVLHQFVRKPWLEPTYHSRYSELLARALLEPWAAIRVRPEELPLRMRRGAAARLSRVAVNARDWGRFHLGHRVPKPLGRRLEDARRRREGSLA